jgi:hypothetical protein
MLFLIHVCFYSSITRLQIKNQEKAYNAPCVAIANQRRGQLKRSNVGITYCKVAESILGGALIAIVVFSLFFLEQ